MRRRISSLVRDTHGLGDFEREIEKELGVPVGAGWHSFFADCELRDLLDTVTIAYRYLRKAARSDRYRFVQPKDWLLDVRRIFTEENIHYTVDDLGSVHFTFDIEFEGNRASAIAALKGNRFANVLVEFEDIDAKLSDVPPNGKGAVRATFSAAEGLFRLIFPMAPRLAASEVDKHLPATVQRIYADDRTALRAASKLISSFKEWVDAAHFYRHEIGKEDVAQPPLPLAINLVSLGASYVRWLAEIDTMTETS